MDLCVRTLFNGDGIPLRLILIRYSRQLGAQNYAYDGELTFSEFQNAFKNNIVNSDSLGLLYTSLKSDLDQEKLSPVVKAVFEEIEKKKEKKKITRKPEEISTEELFLIMAEEEDKIPEDEIGVISETVSAEKLKFLFRDVGAIKGEEFIKLFMKKYDRGE